MTYWTQKELDALAAALQAHLSLAPWNDKSSYLLVDARKRAHAASELPLPCERTLSETRATVCRVCRDERLYKCDVPVGWSMNCALLKLLKVVPDIDPKGRENKGIDSKSEKQFVCSHLKNSKV